MSIIAKNEKQFESLPLPEAGVVSGVCCGVWDLGMQQTKFGAKHKVVIAFELAQLIAAPESEYNGKPYMVSCTYTLSLNEKANLRKVLEGWRGKKYSEDELKKGVDIENLYGVNCILAITHEASQADATKVYANVTAILPPQKDGKKLAPVRLKDEPAPKWVLAKQAAQVTEEAF